MQTKEAQATHELLNEGMDDMIEALVTNTMPTNTKTGQARAWDPKDQFIRDAYKEPLLEGAKV